MERVGTARLVRRKEIRVELVVYLNHLRAGEAVEGRMSMTLTDPGSDLSFQKVRYLANCPAAFAV
jgi:hypothetical protein